MLSFVFIMNYHVFLQNKEDWSNDEFDDDDDDLLSSCLIDESVSTEAKKRKKTENTSTKVIFCYCSVLPK